MTARIHNLSSRRDRFPIKTLASPMVEHAIALWTALEGSDKRGSSELGESWFANIAAGFSPATLEKAKTFGGDHAYPWAAVALVAAAMGPGAEGDEMEWIRSFDFTDVMPLLLDGVYEGSDDTCVARAIGGEDEALTTALSQVSVCSPGGLHPFFTADPRTLGGEIATVLGELMATTLGDVNRIAGQSLQRSAASVSALIPALGPVDLIEAATNGINYQMPLGTTELVLVPSVVVRPWSIVFQLGSVAVIIHPVADVDLDADSEAVPRWLMTYHKALADERRLKMLRRMADGDAGLADLAAAVGLSKSTVIHHLGILRSAGFVRTLVQSDGATTYSLRTASMPDARGALDAYLREPLKEHKGA